MNENLDFDHTVLGSLIARRWTEERPYYSLDERAHGGWLEASWQRRPHRSGLDLHWSRRVAPIRVVAPPSSGRASAHSAVA